MPIKSININPKAFEPRAVKTYSFPRRLIRGMCTGALLPVIGLECFVTGGRTVQAHKRGGFDEARERFTEEVIGAIFWFCGVKAFNRMNEAIGRKILKLDKTAYDVGKDNIRDPLFNYLQDKRKVSKNKFLNEKAIGAFKLTKVLTSIVLANMFVGFIVPKINQRITVNLHNKREAKKNAQQTQQTKEQNSADIKQNFFDYSLNKYINDTENKKQKKNDIGFTSALTLANHIEHDSLWQLLSTDIGVTGGRTINSRNNHERIEVLFRDLSSIYFYMFCMGHVSSVMNLIEDGKPNRLDPVASQQVTDQLKYAFEGESVEGKLTPDEFKKFALGDNDNLKLISKNVNDKINKNGKIELSELLTDINNSSLSKSEKDELIKRARKMSELQPKYHNADILTKAQVQKIYKGGALNMPEFLNNLYGLSINNDMFGSNLDYMHKKPYVYVGEGKFATIDKDVETYIDCIVKKAQKSGEKISIKLLEKVNKSNLVKGAINRFAGFGISALFLSTLIPKIQYWITKKTTGKDSFPGMTDYSDENKKN